MVLRCLSAPGAGCSGTPLAQHRGVHAGHRGALRRLSRREKARPLGVEGQTVVAVLESMALAGFALPHRRHSRVALALASTSTQSEDVVKRFRRACWSQSLPRVGCVIVAFRMWAPTRSASGAKHVRARASRQLSYWGGRACSVLHMRATTSRGDQPDSQASGAPHRCP